MSEFFRKLGVSYSEIDNRYSPLMTNLSGPEAVWSMFRMSGWAVGYTGVNMLARASYSITAPIQVDENNPKLFKVTIRNLSDRRFKVGSESTIEYFKHDLDVLSPMRLVGIHKTLPELIAKINSTAKVQLSLSDFDVENCINDDGMWHLVASEESYFFVKDSFVKFNDRTSWPKIVDWFGSDTIPDLRGLILNLEQPTWDVRRDAVNYIQSNRTFNIPWNDLIEHPLDNNSDGSYRYLVDRKPQLEYIEPQWIQYRKLTLSEYMNHPGAATVGAIPFDRDYRMNVNTRTLYADTATGGTGSGGFIPGTDILFIDTTNKSYNRINIPTDLVGADWRLTQSGIIKVSFKSLYRKGRYSFQLGGISPSLDSYIDNPIPELDRSNILGLGEEASDIPWYIEYFLDFTSGNRPLSTLFINGEFIWEGMVTPTFEELGATNSTVKGKIYIGNTANQTGTHSRLEIADFNLHVLPLGSPKESSYVQVNTSVTELSDGTIYENLPRLNEFYKVHLTEENVEDGPLSTTEPTTLVARDGDVIIEAESEFIVDTAPDLASVFINTELDGFDGWATLGPGQQVSYIGYEYPDGRHTRYMGRVDDTEFFTPQEVMEAVVGDSGITYQIPYSTTQWFKYRIDGDIVYVPMKPLANHISYNELKALGVVNRSGDHLARVPANTVGNYKAGIKSDYRSKIIHKNGRAYAVRMIKGLNKDGPMLPFVNYASDDTWTHDSEWNRMFYNLARQTILPAPIGDIHASQKGPKWEFISAADLVVENNGSDARYTLAPEFTIESSGAKPIYRGCYGVSVRGREAQGPDAESSQMGFRPMLKYLPALETELKLSVEDRGGFKIVNFHPDTDFDYCHDVKIYLRKPNEGYFKPIPFHSAIDDIPIIITEDMVDGDIYFTHSDTIKTYRTEVLSLDIVTLGGEIDLSIMGPGPKVPLRLHSSNDDEELIIGYFGTLTQEEFITPEQFRNLTGLSAGNVKDCGLWMKFMYDGDVCYMPQRALTSQLNMLSVIDAGLRSGKVFHMDGQEFSARVPRGTRYHDIVKYSNKSSITDKEASNQSYQECSEWKELMYRVLDWKSEGSNDSRASDVKPVTADDQWDLMSYSELELADNATTGNYNYAFERYGLNQDNGHMYLGVFGVSRFSHYDDSLTTTTPSYRLGLRPIVYLNRNALKSTSQGTRIQRADGGAWTNLNNNLLPANRSNYNSFVYGDRQYLMYGSNSPAMHVSKEWWSPTSKKTLSNFPSYRHGATATLVGDLVYIIGGRTTLNTANTYNRKLGIYDPLRDTYRETIDLGIDICFHSATAVDGKIYIFGGHDTVSPGGSNSYPAPGFNGKNFYIYDTVAGTFEDRSDIEGLPTIFRQYSQYYDGKIYLFAGGSGDSGGADPDNLFVYDIESNILSTVPNPLKGLVYTYMNSRMENVYGRWMYLLGGYGGGAITNLCYRIDLKTMTYSKLTNLPRPKHNTRPVIINGQYFASAGWDGSGTTPIYRMGTAFNLDT